jgi:hypothetical protein
MEATMKQKRVTVAIRNGAIVPSEDPIVIAGGSHVIHWEIVTAGYTFPADGIALKGGANPEFSNGHPASQGRFYQLNDRNSRAGDHAYSIRVNGSPPVPPLDPTIRNQG